MRNAASLIAVLVLAAVATAICSLPPPPKQFDPGVPSGPGTPDDPDGPETPNAPRGADPRAGSRTGRRTAGGGGFAAAWHLWWELNREDLLGLRHTLRDKEVTSGPSRGPASDRRGDVRQALSKIAQGNAHKKLRAAALRALGRAGGDEEAKLFLRILRSKTEHQEIREAAAIGLGLLPAFKNDQLRADVRKLYSELLEARPERPLAVMALSLRGRVDRGLSRLLAIAATKELRTADAAAAVLYSCGLVRDPLLTPFLFEAARTGRLGRNKLNDIARGYASLALAMTRDPAGAGVLSQLVKSRGVGPHTRRAATLALGLLLRQPGVHGQKVLQRAFEKSRDPLVRAYAAMGMGLAHEPFGLKLLAKAVTRTGAPEVRPFAALSLGLALRRMSGPEADSIRSVLLREFEKGKRVQLDAALSIALGVSGTRKAEQALLDRLGMKRLNPAVRGPAIQGLGLLGRTSAKVEATLREALKDGPDEVVEDAAMALGLLGTRSTAAVLVAKLAQTKSEPVQSHMVAALSHLGGTAAIDPLLELLRNTSLKHTIRESAAAALGILVDSRERDVLFEIDAHTYPYGLTLAGRKLVLVY